MAKNFFIWQKPMSERELNKRSKGLQEEEFALSTLRQEIQERLSLVKRKEEHLYELEQQFQIREKQFRKEEKRAEELREEAIRLSDDLNKFEQILAEKKQEAKEARAVIEQLNPQLELINTRKAELQKKELAAAAFEKKEKRLYEIEQQFQIREKQFRKEEKRAEELREEEIRLTDSVARFENILKEKEKEAKKAQVIIEKLNSELELINTRKAELQKKELAVAALEKQEKQLSLLVAKKEKRIKDGMQILSDIRQDLEKANMQFAQITAKLEESTLLLKNFPEEIKSRKKELAILSEQKELLEKTLADKTAKINALADKEKALTQKITNFDKLSSKIAQIENKEQYINMLVKEKKNVLADLRKSIDYNTQLLEALKNQEAKVKAATQSFLITQEEHRSRIAREEKELAAKNKIVGEKIKELSAAEQSFDKKLSAVGPLRAEVESLEKRKQEALGVFLEKRNVLSDLRKSILEQQKTLEQLKKEEDEARLAAQKLVQKQHDFNNRLKLVEQKENAALNKEDEQAKKEKILVKRESILQEATQILTKDRDSFIADIKAREDAFLAVRQEWKDGIEQLKREKEEVRQEKEEVRKLISADAGKLKSKEEELQATLSGIEKDRKTLRVKEEAFANKVREFNRTKELFEKEKDALEKEKTQMQTLVLQALRQNIAESERIIQRKIELETERKKSEVNKAPETKIPHTLKQKYAALQKTANRIQAMDKIASTERKYDRESVEEKQATCDEIKFIISQAKQSINGNIGDAERLVSEAETLIERVKDQEQKRLLQYDLKDVKTSIKLAML